METASRGGTRSAAVSFNLRSRKPGPAYAGSPLLDAPSSLGGGGGGAGRTPPASPASRMLAAASSGSLTQHRSIRPASSDTDPASSPEPQPAAYPGTQPSRMHADPGFSRSQQQVVPRSPGQRQSRYCERGVTEVSPARAGRDPNGPSAYEVLLPVGAEGGSGWGAAAAEGDALGDMEPVYDLMAAARMQLAMLCASSPGGGSGVALGRGGSPCAGAAAAAAAPTSTHPTLLMMGELMRSPSRPTPSHIQKQDDLGAFAQSAWVHQQQQPQQQHRAPSPLPAATAYALRPEDHAMQTPAMMQKAAQGPVSPAGEGSSGLSVSYLASHGDWVSASTSCPVHLKPLPAASAARGTPAAGSIDAGNAALYSASPMQHCAPDQSSLPGCYAPAPAGAPPEAPAPPPPQLPPSSAEPLPPEPTFESVHLMLSSLGLLSSWATPLARQPQSPAATRAAGLSPSRWGQPVSPGAAAASCPPPLPPRRPRDYGPAAWRLAQLEALQRALGAGLSLRQAFTVMGMDGDGVGGGRSLAGGGTGAEAASM